MEKQELQMIIKPEDAAKLHKAGMISEETFKKISKKYADGGVVSSDPVTIPFDNSFMPQTSDNSAVSTPQVAPTEEAKSPALDISGIPDFSQKGIDQATVAGSPSARFDFYKKNYDYMSDADILKQLKKEDTEKQGSASERMSESTKQNNALADTAMQKQAQGIALTPKEKSLLDSGYQNSSQNNGAPTPDQYQLQTAQPGNGNQSQQGFQKNMQNVMGLMDQGYSNIEKGIMSASGAAAKNAAYINTLTNDVAKNFQERQKEQDQKMAEQHAQLQEKADQYEKSVNEFMKNATVDPDRYWNNKSTGSKIGAAIAVAFGGLGRGNVQNGAYDVIKDAINRDVDAQKASIQNQSTALQMQNNVYSHMSSLFQDQRAAYSASQASLLSIAEMRVKASMASLQGAQAQGDGLKLLGQIQNEKAQRLRETYMYTQAGGGLTNDPAQNKLNMLGRTQMISPEEKKELNEKLDDYNKVQKSHQLLQDSIDQMHENRLQATPSQAMKYKNATTVFASNAKELFGRASEGDIHQMLDTAPGKLSTIEGRDNLKKLMEQKLDTEHDFSRLKAYGLIKDKVPMRDVTNGK